MLGIIYGKRLCAENLKERYRSEDMGRRISWRCTPGDGVALAREVVVPVRAVVFSCALRGVLASVPLSPQETITIIKMPAADLSYGWTGYYSTIRTEQKNRRHCRPHLNNQVFYIVVTHRQR